MDNTDKVLIYALPVIVLVLMVVVILNLTKVLALGEMGTLVGVSISGVALSLSMVRFSITIKKLTGRYNSAKRKIEEICDGAASRGLPPLIEVVFENDNAEESKEFRSKVKEEVVDLYIHYFDINRVKEEISEKYLEHFMLSLGVSFFESLDVAIRKEELRDFVLYLISRSFGYSDIAVKIKLLYQERPNSDFNLLCDAHSLGPRESTENLTSLLGRVFGGGDGIVPCGPPKPEVEKLEKIPDLDKSQLGSYLVGMLRASLSTTTFIEVLKGLSIINPSFFVVIGEGGEGRDEGIYRKLINSGAEPVAAGRYRQAVYVRAKDSYETTSEFLKEEVLGGAKEHNNYIIMAARLFPGELAIIQNGDVPEYYDRLYGLASQIKFDEKNIEKLLAITGNSFVGVVEYATLDFFASRDDTLARDELNELALSSKVIFDEIRPGVEVGMGGTTAILGKVGVSALAKSISINCRFPKNRSLYIAKSIKENVLRWSNYVY